VILTDQAFVMNTQDLVNGIKKISGVGCVDTVGELNE